jgi:alkylation response protein AidB-like acyl-CoA dehydrogenase
MAEAHLIKSEQEALETAKRIAEQISPDSAARDKERRLPFEEIEWFSQSGLCGITVPKEYGGAGVSTATFLEVVVAEVKIAATDTAILATNKLFELAGTQSTLESYSLDRHCRNARVHTLHDPVRWKYYAVGNFYLNDVAPPGHAWL